MMAEDNQHKITRAVLCAALARIRHGTGHPDELEEATMIEIANEVNDLLAEIYRGGYDLTANRIAEGRVGEDHHGSA